jgi:peptide/nickel transport system permease protein
LGTSITSQRPVLEDLLRFFPATLELVILALALMILVGVPSGVLSAVNRGAAVDALTRVPTIIGTGIPLFWLGLIGQFFLYYRWGLLPYGGQVPDWVPEVPRISGLLSLDTLLVGNFRLFGHVLLHLIMPVAVLASGRVAIITRLTRASILEVLGQDFIRTARAKGLRQSAVLFKHALRPGLIPILTETGLQFGWILGGTVIVESIFAWPGVGRYVFTAIQGHDIQAVMGVTLLLTFFKVMANLVVDVMYAAADPRVRY